MNQLPSDTIYRDLKQRGLDLSPCARVQVPEPQPIKIGVLKKLSSIMVRKKEQSTQSPMKVIQILYNCFLAIKRHCIFVYSYTYNQQSKSIQINLARTYNLTYQIEQVHTCLSKFIQDRDFPIIIKNQTGVVYFNFDLKQYQLQEKNSIKLENVIGVGWISDRECIVVDGDTIKHFHNLNGLLTCKSTHPVSLRIQTTQNLKKMWILGKIDEHQDSVLSIIYITLPKQQVPNKKRIMSLKIKQFIRTLDGDVTTSPKPDYFLQTKSLQYKQNFNIIAVGQYYCLQLASQILIMKKKFDKYMLLDNLVEVMHGYEVKLNKKGLIVSIGENLLQLNCIHFADPKCGSRICDVIEFPPQLKGYHKNFKQIWPIINQKQYTLIFVFVKDNEIILSGLIKMQPMHKMMAIAKKNPKNKLEVVQEMALNLGIKRKDFYLKLWTTSKKQNADIYQYLIPCKDVNSIKKQLKFTLRQRTIQVSQMLKILQKILQQNMTNLKADLNINNLRDYLKTDFLRKKIILNSMDKLLDHRIFDKIYSSSLLDTFQEIVREELDPVKPKFDPLNSSMNYQPIKQLKSLEMVFKQFKVLLLEDYKNFLIQFLSRFPNKILQVLNRFNFLLPNHPFQIQVQKPSKTNEPIIFQIKPNATPQQLWFQTVTVSEWQAQVTKQKILKSLFYDFQTSKILETVDEFSKSLYGRENRRWKHGLITLSLDQYIQKLKNINGIQLYLDVCQFANEISVNRQDGDPKISQKIIQKLREKNNLTDPDAHYCKLYATMHYFMLKNKIIPKNKLQITMLTKLRPESLVAIFFLQNKQRKQHIFGDFKNLYDDKNQFKEVLEKFVQSQNCSRIQLQILMKQIQNKGQQFQQKNQDIIDIMITGICMKVEIRQCLVILDKDEDQGQQTCIIDTIQLNKDLALKVNRVKRLKLCKNIFKSFGLEKKTYKQLLDLQVDNGIFSLLLQKYFQIREDQNRVEQFEVAIEDQQRINLQNPRNLLTILVYLQQNVYYSAKTFDIAILFGLQLILWKQFAIMRDLVNDYNALQTLGVDRTQYIQALTTRALQNIYLDPDIIYDQETSQQIINILNIDDEISCLKIRENAKLELVKVFTDWGLEVHPSDIHTICYEWKQQNRQDFMVDLINKYVQKLDFRTFQQIFRLLEITDKETIDVNILNVQYLIFCGYYAKKLLQCQRYKQVIEVIIFLMKYQEAGKVDYAMLVQSYIKTVIEMFSENEEKCRKYIQFFVQKYDTQEYSVRQLLQSQFDENVIYLWNRNPSILIDPKYLFENAKKFECYIELDELWEMAKAQASNTQQIYYNYFFLMMGLTNPPKGFGETVGISYNLEKLNNLVLGDLDNLLQKNQDLWFVNYHQIQKYFFYNGILGEAIHALQLQIPHEQRHAKYKIIIDQLKNVRGQNPRNERILSILAKLKSEISSRGNKKVARRERNDRRLKQLADQQTQRNKQLELNLEVPEQKVQQQQQKFLNWQTIQEQKEKSRFSLSQIIISQKELIDQVYEHVDTAKFKQKYKTKPLKPSFFSHLFATTLKGTQKTNKIVQIIKQGRYEQLATQPQNTVMQVVNKLFNQDPQINYNQISQVLKSIHVGEQIRHQIFAQAKDYLKYLPNQVKRVIFPIQFFTTRIQHQNQRYSQVYEQLKPKITQIIPKLNNKELNQLASMIGVCLHSSRYADKIYYQALMYTGMNCLFDANSALIAQECINGLASNRQIITGHYRQILDNMTYDKQMRPYVKQLLVKVSQKKYNEITEQIRKIPSFIQ